MEKHKVFLDTSVLITALLSAKGASFHLITEYASVCQFFINDYILEEILDVLRRKFTAQTDMSANFFLLLGLAAVEIVMSPRQGDLKSVSTIIEPEDAPILVSALEYCDYLLTLDNDFLAPKVTQHARAKKLMIMKPGEFLKSLRSAS